MLPNWHQGEKDFLAGMPDEKEVFFDLAVRRDPLWQGSCRMI